MPKCQKHDVRKNIEISALHLSHYKVPYNHHIFLSSQNWYKHTMFLQAFLLVLITALLSFQHAVTAFSTGNRVFVGTPSHKTKRLVSDCMTPINQLCTFTPSTTVHDAVQQLLNQGVSGAPVISDQTGELLGVVSSFDVLQQEAGDGILLPIMSEDTVQTHEVYLQAAKKICATRVGDLMSSNPITVESTTDMRSATAVMTQAKLHRLPVVDDGILVGILTCSDVMIDMVRSVQALAPVQHSAASSSEEEGGGALNP